MITLTGLLRQRSEMEIKGINKLKLIVEHEIERNEGDPDIELQTFFLDPSESQKCPQKGENVSLEVRPWTSGRNVAYSAIRLLGGAKKA